MFRNRSQPSLKIQHSADLEDRTASATIYGRIKSTKNNMPVSIKAERLLAIQDSNRKAFGLTSSEPAATE